MSELELAPDVRSALERMVATDPKAYKRERAAAILKIADGMSPYRVAREGLLKRRDPDSVYDWRNRFREKGIAGLTILPGRGRKSVEARAGKTREEAKATIKDVLGRDPIVSGKEHSRWRLGDIIEECHEWIPLMSPSGMCRLLDRLGISYKRGRDYVHSPDPDYVDKRKHIDRIITEVRASEGRQVFLYLDELSYYRQPTVARAYAERGPEQALAMRSHASNTMTRVVGVIDIITGQVNYRQGTKVGIDELVRFYREIREGRPSVDRIYLCLDNWPVHFHPDVLVALEEQENPWPVHVPKKWPKEPSQDAIRRWGGLKLPIQLVPLPTYASWLNPIEKLWRWAKQDVLHMHRLAERLDELRQLMRGFLDGFSKGSSDLLRYVGLPAPA